MIHRLPRIVLGWLRALVARDRIERDLDDELRFFIDAREKRLVDAGVAPAEARRRARIDAGGLEQVKEAVRESWRTTVVEDSMRDVRYGLRALRRAPGFTVVALLTLALGIGASTAMFSQINAVFLTALPMADAGALRLIDWTLISDEEPRRSRPSKRLSYPAYVALRDRAGVFDSVACWSEAVLNYGAGDRVEAHVVSGNYFSTLGAKALVGRTITEEDERRGAAVAVISHGLWQRMFEGHRSVTHDTILINGRPVRVVGVMPDHFIGLNPARAADVYLPLSMYSDARFDAAAPRRLDNARDWSACEVVARLKQGVTDDAARLEAQAIVAQAPFASDRGSGPLLPAAGPESSDAARGLRLVPAARGTDDLRQDTSQSLSVLMAATLLVLLIACTNVGGLLLARVPARTREVGTRLALGASRRRVARQLIVESFVLACAAGVLGIAVAHGFNRFLPGLLGRFISGGADVARVAPATDLRVLLFALAASTMSGVVFAVAPALAATRLNLAGIIKQAPPPAGTPTRVVGSQTLIAAQVALALVLLIGAGLLLRTTANLRAAEDPALAAQTLHFSASPGLSGYRDAELRQWFEKVVTGLAALPGVAAATGLGAGTICIAAHDREEFVATNAVAPDQFRATDQALVSGRDFTWDDTDGERPVAIANEAFVREYLDDGPVMGARVRICGDDLMARVIVGVVADAVEDPRQEAEATLYVPFTQPPPPLTNNIIAFTVRAHDDANAILSSVESVVGDVDPHVPIFDVETGEGRRDRSILRERMVTGFVTLYGGIALFLASLGIYGVLAYTVSRRTAEVGVRIALGADRPRVVSMIVRESLRPVAAGMAIGIVAAVVLTPWLSGVLFGVAPRDLRTFAAAAAIFLVAAALAALLPALRAARINPMQALRVE